MQEIWKLNTGVLAKIAVILFVIIMMMMIGGIMMIDTAAAQQNQSNNETVNNTTTEEVDNNIIKQLGTDVRVMSSAETDSQYRVKVMVTSDRPVILYKAWKTLEWFPEEEKLVLENGMHTIVFDKKGVPTALLHPETKSKFVLRKTGNTILDESANPIYTWGIAISTSIVGLAVYVRREVKKEKNEETKLID